MQLPVTLKAALARAHLKGRPPCGLVVRQIQSTSGGRVEGGGEEGLQRQHRWSRRMMSRLWCAGTKWRQVSFGERVRPLATLLQLPGLVGARPRAALLAASLAEPPAAADLLPLRDWDCRSRTCCQA